MTSENTGSLVIDQSHHFRDSLQSVGKSFEAASFRLDEGSKTWSRLASLKLRVICDKVGSFFHLFGEIWWKKFGFMSKISTIELICWKNRELFRHTLNIYQL